MPEQNPPEIDPLDPVEPTDAEVAAAAAVEAADTAREAKKATAPRKGPGRPPGAKNRSKGTTEATTRATTTRTSSAAPRSTPAAVLPGTTDAAGRAERKRVRDERNARVNELTADMLKHKPSVARAVGMATGIPGQYLVGIEVDPTTQQPIIDHDTQQPREALTHYGQALAPQDWQVKTCVEAYVRLEESEQGQKLLEAADRLMPYAMMVGALGAFGMYTLTVMQASTAIRDMVKVEMQAAAQAAAAQAPGTPDGGVPG